MANMKDFLTMYYNRLIFREMQYEQFVQFCGYIKDKKATDNQKIWAEELLKKDPATGEFMVRPNTNIYIPKELPDPADPTEGLDDKEWKKLFRAFQSAFQSMDGAKKDFKYNDKATKFLEQYFGSHTSGTATIQHLFQYTKATPAARNKIGPAPTGATTVTLHGFLTKYKNRLELQLKNWGILTDDFSYDDLLSGIASEKYNKNPKFRKNMERVAQVIDGYIAGDPTMQQRLGITNPNEIPDCSDIGDWFDDNNISTYRLDQFKHEYATLLNTLRKESKIREVFEQHDDGKISGPLNKAIKNQSYDDPKSEDYVPPKREDTLTMPERLSEWWSDTYSDCLEKYAKLKGDRLFFSDEAKNICKHLQKNLNKTDGLDGVLKNVGTAKDKLKAAREFKSVKHLEWFEKTMNALKNDPKLSKVWAGALKNGTHLQALVKEVIIRAIQEGKKDEAKTALELISVLHYDYTTSKIMDALKKENLTIFSDGKLSWNKNEGVKFVTAALDKSIKAAFMGIGYGITIAGNAYRLSGSKITKYSDRNGAGNFKQSHDAYLQKQQDDKAALEVQLNAERGHQSATQRTVDRIRGGRTYDVAKADMERDIQGYTTAIDTFCAADVQALKTALAQTYNNVTSGGAWNPIANQTEYEAVSDFLDSINSDTLKPKPTLTGTGAPLQVHLDAIETGFPTLKQNRRRLGTRQRLLEHLVNGQELLDQLNEQITRHEDEVNNWDASHFDEMEELALYWNRLETGRNTKMGPMYNWFRNLSAKSAQKRFAGQRGAIIADYNSSHSIAA